MKFPHTHTHRQSTSPFFSVSLQTSHVFGRRTLIRRKETAWQLLKKPVFLWQIFWFKTHTIHGTIVYLPNSTQFLQLLYCDGFPFSKTSLAKPSKPIPTYLFFPPSNVGRPTESRNFSHLKTELQVLRRRRQRERSCQQYLGEVNEFWKKIAAFFVCRTWHIGVLKRWCRNK